MMVDLGAGSRVVLNKNDLLLKDFIFKGLNVKKGKLVLQFDTHLVTYSLADLTAAVSKKEECKPFDTKVIDRRDAGTLYFDMNDDDFFFKCKKAENTMGFYLD